MDIRDCTDVLNFKRAADRFCQLLEVRPADANHWEEATLAGLAGLYASGHALPDLGLPDDAADVPDTYDVSDDEWKRVFGLVYQILGDQTGYWVYFDPSEPTGTSQEPIFGDLGDDLADIYRDVKPGLRAWEGGNDAYLPAIVFDWKFPLFGSHWGVHAVSAMRALHPIAFLRGVREDV
jgi:hypothetical protein